MRVVVAGGSTGCPGGSLVTALEAVRDGLDTTRPLLTVDEVICTDDPSVGATGDFVCYLVGWEDGGHPDAACAARWAERLAVRPVPVLVASSLYADEAADEAVWRETEARWMAYGSDTGRPVMIYRLPRVFGPWSRPFGRDPVATLCYQLMHGLPLTPEDAFVPWQLAYADDVVADFLRVVQGFRPWPTPEGLRQLTVVHDVTAGEVAERLMRIQRCDGQPDAPYLADELTRKLYAVYGAGRPKDRLIGEPAVRFDERGNGFVFVNTPDRGQVAVEYVRPGRIKGEHWHACRYERWCVVSGNGVIRVRDRRPDARGDEGRAWVYRVSGKRPAWVEIPPGTIHSVENTGRRELTLLIWYDRAADPYVPDTFAEPLREGEPVPPRHRVLRYPRRKRKNNERQA